MGIRLWSGRLSGMAVAFAVTLSAAAGHAAGPREHVEDTADHVHVIASSLLLAKDGYRLVVTLEIDRGFHINANPASDEDLIPTVLRLRGITPRRVIYPKPVPFKPGFSAEALAVYEGTVQIAAELSRDAADHSPLSGTVTAQACTDQICLPPAEVPLPDVPINR